MHWMVEWAGAFPVFVAEASGARFTDVDGNDYVDLCLGDTGAMTGHAPAATAEAVCDQVRKGTTLMLPTEDAIACAEEFTGRFGLPIWQFALTATDANRFTIRLARQVTGRAKILVHNWCYHGSVDETFITLDDEGRPQTRPHNIGAAVPPAETTRVVEINDLDALERELAHGDVACCLFEPALTNIGIVLPDAGYHEAVRELCRRHGTFLVIDETHTICAGPGGYTRAYDLEPDFLTVGKPLAGGIPAAAYGMSEETARRVIAALPDGPVDVGGIGGTLAGNALSLRAMRATLTAGAHRGGLRAHDPARRAVHRRGAGRDRRLRPRLVHHPARLPGRVRLPARPAPQRRRGGGVDGPRARPLHAPLRAQPRRADDAVPQHGADVARDRRRRRRPPHRGVRRGRARAHRLIHQCRARRRRWG